ncbi:hypothetical protein M406DRAFT_13931, partial [Cryphonectria parasitica EP155]
GPTGLLTGLLCERLGASVCIIDSKPSTLDLGRADALNARTQQYLEIVGVLDELLPQGLKCNTSSTYENGAWTSRQSHWWTGLEHTLHKNFLMIGQPVVERIFASRLQTTQLLFDTRCVAMEESDSSVKTTTDNEDHPVIHSKYVVGADGARSTVRHLMGISFKGTKPEMVWTVLDTFIDTDFPRADEIITFQRQGKSRVSWIPRERGMARFYTLLDEDQEKTQMNSETSIREHMHPHQIKFVKTEWFSIFEIKERIAGTFVTKSGQGRVCLAGDAAHVHSVNGGQGLNTGIADAFALAWRLAYIAAAVHGQLKLAPGAETRLLRSYDTERRAVAQGVIDVASRLVRDTLRTAKEYVQTIETNAGYITGMGVAYDSVGSELVQTGGRKNLACWTCGQRCPDLRLVDKDGKTSRVYSLAQYGKFCILLFGKGNLDMDTTWPPPSRALFYKVLPADTPAVAEIKDVVWSVAEPVVGALDSFIVVVRPDMYIGFVGEGNSWLSYLA